MVGNQRMEITYKIDKEKGTIFMKAQGDISIEDLIAFEKNLLKDPLFEAGLNSFVDFSKAQSTHDVDIEKIKMSLEYIESIQDKRGRCKWAIYAPYDYLYTFWLIFEGLSDKLNIEAKVFKDKEEAKTWLGI